MSVDGGSRLEASVREDALEEAKMQVLALREAIEEYLLWRPCEKGHAAAHKRLAAALGGDS